MKEKPKAEAVVREIRRKTRRKYSAEEKIRIVLEGLRGKESTDALCRREGIPQNIYYEWREEFLEAGKERLQEDTKEQDSGRNVGDLREENEYLKQLADELSLKNRILKKGLDDLESRWSRS